MMLTFVLSAFLSLPSLMFDINAYDVMLRISYGRKSSIKAVAQNFIRNWKRYLGIAAWSELWIWLWTFVFFIPGIVKRLSYMLAPFLIVQYPDMPVRVALKKSKEITYGYKGRLFGLGLVVGLPILIPMFIAMIYRFSGSINTYDIIMGISTPIIGLFLVQPISYMMYTIAYLDIKKAAIKNGQLPSESSHKYSVSSNGASIGS